VFHTTNPISSVLQAASSRYWLRARQGLGEFSPQPVLLVFRKKRRARDIAQSSSGRRRRTTTMAQETEEAFQEACAQFRTAPDLFRDEDRLHLYALYKQATAGKAPGYNAKTPRRALLRGAELAAWRSLQDMPSPEAKRAYAKIVADNRKNRETKEPQTPRTRSKTAAAAWRADRDLLDASLDGMDPKTLLAHARKLRDRVQTLSVGHVMRGGELIRHRETLTGHDWASRYFEVVPGFLRCYKSRTARELRLEVPLSPSVKVVADDVFDRKERKRAPTPFLLKLFLDKATMGASSRVTEITLAAPSKRDRDDWLQCVNASIELNASPLAMPSPPVQKKKKRSSTELLARTVHRRARPSLLSSDSSEAQSYGGFVNLIAVVAVVSNSRALLQEWHRIPLVRSIRAHFAEEAPVLTKRGRPVPPPVMTESVVPYELGLSFIALCLCVVLAVLVERRAARAPGRAASFHLLRALVVFSTLAVPLALSCSGVLTVSRRWRGHAATSEYSRHHHNTGAAPRPRGPCPTPSRCWAPARP
jgi:acyl-CoA-binding protein